MKKIFYAALFLLAAVAVGCADADNGAGEGDAGPAVTIYPFAAPAGYDTDITCNLRVAPNALTNDLHVLTELKATKEAYIASNGVDAYTQYVISKGKHYKGENQDILFENLAGTYAITIVSVQADGVAAAFEYIFKGILWKDYAEGTYTSAMMGGIFTPATPRVWAQKLQVAEGTQTYRLKDWFHNYGAAQTVAGYHLIFSWDGGATIMPQGTKNSDGSIGVQTGFMHPTYGMCSMVIDPDPKYSGYIPASKTFVFNAKLMVSAGTLVDWADDTYKITKTL